jgi:predicted acyltransferase
MAAVTRPVRPQVATEPQTPAPNRVVALDALRGFDMFWIVGGQELALAVAKAFHDPVPPWVADQFEHRPWEGFTAWDLIMPLFLFVVGAAMPFSFARRIDDGQSKRELYLKIIRRTLILFVLGMAVQGHLLDFNASTLHVYANTLQAIAAGYLVAGLVMLNVGVLWQVVVTAALLIGYWLILMYVPLAGHGAGVIEEKVNVAMAVDEYVLGRFRDGTTYTWVLSSMTFAASVFLGVFSGYVLRSTLSPFRKFLALVALGVGCLAAGYSWAEWLGLPIIKHIWTSSMTLWAAGWSYLLLALFYLVIDIGGFRRWAFPLVVIGMNAITIYVAWHFVPFTNIAKGLVGGAASHFGSAGPAIVAFTAVLLWWLILYHMYRRKIFLRI